MKKGLIILSLLGMFFLGSCATAFVNAEQTNPIKIWPENQNGALYTSRIVDDVTGVNYIVVASKPGPNDAYKAVAVCPRYNKDGTLYSTK